MKATGQIWTLGEALERTVADAWILWNRMHRRPGLSRIDMWKAWVLRIDQEVTYFQNCRVRVMVRIEARQPWEREVFVYGFDRVDTDRVRLTDAS